MKFRQHCGGLQEALATLVELEPTATAVRDHLNEVHEQSNKRFFFLKPADILCELYYDEPDDRIGWEKTYLLSDHSGPIGFCDEMLKDPA